MMTADKFREHVAEALDSMPPEFREKMVNVEVIVEDFADRETLRSVGARSRWDLLGLYVGVPITHRSVFDAAYLPERIYLYRRPIVRAAGRSERVVAAIRDVLLHEVGHHFGFSEEELQEMDSG
ncbi:MAG: metallopeptidase family protein [Deltaproteobacteria bacterium]|nr:metallopeptidase family protein [Deltaproteobacteria bacterium]